MKSEIKCSKCEKTFTARKNLYKHSRNIHQIDLVPAILKYYNCKTCEKKFCSERTLAKHIKTFHKNESNDDYVNPTRIICPYISCSKSLFKFENLRKHLSDNHGYIVKLEEMVFPNITEFERWKHKEEQENDSMYVLNRGKKKLHDGNLSGYYYCHRSYNHRKVKNSLRESKNVGSYKIGGACPSMIEGKFVESDGSVQIKYWKNHCGHDKKIGRIRLNKKASTLIIAEPIEKEDCSIIEVFFEEKTLLELQPTSVKKINNFNVNNKLKLAIELSTASEICDKDAAIIGEKLDDIIVILNKYKNIVPIKIS